MKKKTKTKKQKPAKKTKNKKADPKPKKAKRKTIRTAAEPTSGSAGSSLDPRRQGRFTVEREAGAAGRGRQAGDHQGISRREDMDSESVEELLEEGQAFEAAAIEGVEDAPDADKGEVRTHEVPQDDVPHEYEDKDRF